MPPGDGGAAALERDLIREIILGDRGGVEQALSAGASPNATDDEGKPAITIAVEAGNREVGRALAEHGANVEARNNDGSTLGWIAAWKRTRDRASAHHWTHPSGSLDCTHYCIASGVDEETLNAMVVALKGQD